MHKRKFKAACLVLSLSLALSVGAAAAVSGAPVAENLELTTYRNVCVGGTLSAVDPEGDPVTFEITTEPTKGTVELTSDGRFVYTPDANRKGRDYFGYRAVDDTGARSQEATVIIKIEKQKTQTTYADMAGHPDAYAATALSEYGIFTAETVGGVQVFSPEREVTRAEFLSMCMTLAGDGLLSGVAATGFADDGDIESWLKPYVATALMDGMTSRRRRRTTPSSLLFKSVRRLLPAMVTPMTIMETGVFISPIMPIGLLRISETGIWAR